MFTLDGLVALLEISRVCLSLRKRHLHRESELQTYGRFGGSTLTSFCWEEFADV